VNIQATPQVTTLNNHSLAQTGKHFNEFALAVGRTTAIKWLKGKGYKLVEVAKKDGSIRTCYAPTEGLKQIQRELDTLLRQFDTSKVSHGFTTGRSNKTAAIAHQKKWIKGMQYTMIGTDLKEAFPSIKEHSIRKMLREKMPQLTGWQIHCWTKLLSRRNNPKEEGELATGSPASPTILNILMQDVDAKLDRLARQKGGTYTRYADDLCISIPTHKSTRIAKVRQAMRRILRKAGFTPHQRKHYTQKLGKDVEHAEVVGVKTSPTETRTPQKLTRKLRAWKHNLRRTDKGDEQGTAYWKNRVSGLSRYIGFICQTPRKC
jgi:hypothetical protein